MSEKRKDEIMAFRTLINSSQNISKPLLQSWLKTLKRSFDKRYKEVKEGKEIVNTLSVTDIAADDLVSIWQKIGKGLFREIPPEEVIATLGEALGGFIAVCEFGLGEIKDDGFSEDELLHHVDVISDCLNSLQINKKDIIKRLKQIYAKKELNQKHKRILGLIIQKLL